MMRYKVFVSTEAGSYESFYCDRKDQAHLLFNMAKSSDMFDYVSLSETIDEDFLVRDWTAEEAEGNG